MSGKYLSEESKKQLNRQRRNRRMALSAAMRWIIGLVAAAVILLNLFTHVVQPVRYSGSGMEPSLHGGQMLLIRKTQNVEEGDIIAFYYNNQVLVRRVICQGGKQLSIESDGTVRINSEVLEEPYVESPSIGQCNLEFPYYVQTGYVFVMGDNRAVAMDSRLAEIGCVPVDRIIGKVLFA